MRNKNHLFVFLLSAAIAFSTGSQAQDMALSPLKFTAKGSSSGRMLQKPVNGTITDDKGSGLAGVSITVKGTSIGTVTDGKGFFSLIIPDENANDSLLFSSIGFDEQVIAIRDQSVFNLVLTQNISTLNQVVVVGYGTQRRTAVTAAIASVPMKEIKDMPVSNVATALQGKIPGIIVQQNNGAPGSTPAIKVRGLGSISAGNSPLIVVDGNIV